MTRWISGVIVAALVLLLLRFVPGFGIQMVVLLFSGLGLSEYFNMTIPHATRTIKNIGILTGVLACTSFMFWVQTADHFLLVSSLMLMLTFILHFRGSSDFNARIQQMAFFYLGLMYISLLFSYWGKIRALPDWAFWVFMMLGCTVMADIGGYVFGHWIGKTKLAPKLSPGKTVEGFLGGVLFALIGGVIVRCIFKPDYPFTEVVLLSTLLAFVGPIGDLSESMIKRGAGVKDSGNLMPGHGGLLDRVDALLFTAPIVYYFAKYFS